MIVREWNIETPTPHVIQLEYRLLQGDVVLRVNGGAYASWSIWRPSPPIDPILIDGVSYSMVRIPGLRGRYEVLPTELIALLPQPQFLQRGLLIRATVALGLSVTLLVAAENARFLVRRYGLQWEDEPLVTGVLVVASIFFAAVFGGLIYLYWTCQRSARHSYSDHIRPRPIAAAGALPRDSCYFRPLLTDITATAARWKRQMLGIPTRRH